MANRLVQWVRKVLTLEGLVVNKRKPKHNFTPRELTRILLTLWTKDDLIFIPERYRIQSTFIVRVYCWTTFRLLYKRTSVSGCRTGAAADICRWLEAHLQG